MGNRTVAPHAGGGEPRHEDESFRHGVAPRDAAVAEARSGGEQQGAHAVQLRAPPRPEQSPVHGGAMIQPPLRPSYVPLWQRRVVEEEEKQRHAAAPPHAAAPEEPQQAEKMPVVVLAGPRPPRTITIPKTTVRTGGAPADGDGAARSLTPSLHYQNKMKRKPLAFCRIVFYIHVLLLIKAVCLATIAVSLAYHPKSPRLSVTSATLNAAHIDELGDGGRGGERRAISANPTVIAAISSPNTKINIVLRYVRFDLYFEDSVIATQAVWPAPVQVAPGGSVLRRVHLVVSNMSVTQQDEIVWQNATAKGSGPVALRLAGRFHTQLNFDRWFIRYRYWVKQQCRLWLDRPPSGAL